MKNAQQEKALFAVNLVVVSAKAGAAMEKAGQSIMELFVRHLSGDWGELSEEEKAKNRLALRKRRRLVSLYVLSTKAKVLVFTESDRSATTFLLPEEY